MTTPHRNGCYDHTPFTATFALSDGRRIKNIFAGALCEYTLSQLGQQDKGCVGCVWQRDNKGAA